MEKLKLERVTPTLSIYQQKGVFSYGTDAVLLSRFVSSSFKSLNGKKMCDLCSGTGIIPLLLCDSCEGLLATSVEINEDACRIALMSAEVSGLDKRYTQIKGDLRSIRDFFPSESFDYVTCNPPYMTSSSGYMCETDYKTIARHEILCNINDVFKSAFYLLKTGGSIFIVYRSDRLSSLFSAAAQNRFEIKEMISFVSGDLPAKSKLVVCRASKDSREGLKHTVCEIEKYLTGECHV